ncbi:hypothetical protein AG1IA_05651 [Rhizoctonia solani AG-1 IA]|uniref:Uncharacterized protein n=1 Tax=Thanatephorus cucumeris (strain AG1-IA) TaxID=983506 RepID=L8WUA2_THACA|nr:hypothetical protein AG1IA_05651 [Rhizoctonia solani AG-1 IA]
MYPGSDCHILTHSIPRDILDNDHDAPNLALLRNVSPSSFIGVDARPIISKELTVRVVQAKYSTNRQHKQASRYYSRLQKVVGNAIWKPNPGWLITTLESTRHVCEHKIKEGTGMMEVGWGGVGGKAKTKNKNKNKK